LNESEIFSDVYLLKGRFFAIAIYHDLRADQQSSPLAADVLTHFQSDVRCSGNDFVSCRFVPCGKIFYSTLFHAERAKVLHIIIVHPVKALDALSQIRTEVPRTFVQEWVDFVQ